jgi:hypothetical protein
VEQRMTTTPKYSLGKPNVNAMLEVAEEGQNEEVYDIIGEAIPIWNMHIEFRPQAYQSVLLLELSSYIECFWCVLIDWVD